MEKFIYVGELITIDGDITKEISRRMSLGWRVYNYRKLFRSKVQIKKIIKIMEHCGETSYTICL